MVNPQITPRIRSFVKQLDWVELYALDLLFHRLMKCLWTLYYARKKSWYREVFHTRAKVLLVRIYGIFPHVEKVLSQSDLEVRICNPWQIFRGSTRKGYRRSAALRELASLKCATQRRIEKSTLDWERRALLFLSVHQVVGSYHYGDEEALVFLASRGRDCHHEFVHTASRWNVDSQFWNIDESYQGLTAALELRLCQFAAGAIPEEYWRNTSEILDGCFMISGLESDYMTIFPLLQSDMAVLRMGEKLEAVLRQYEVFLKEVLVDENSKLPVALLACADYIFGHHRLMHNDLNKSLMEKAITHLIQSQLPSGSWCDDKNLSPQWPLSLTVMVIHALGWAKTEQWSQDSRQKAFGWLLSQQHPYGYWQEHIEENPVPLTVAVTDALGLCRCKQLLTFGVAEREFTNEVKVLPEEATARQLADAYSVNPAAVRRKLYRDVQKFEKQNPMLKGTRRVDDGIGGSTEKFTYEVELYKNLLEDLRNSETQIRNLRI